MEEKMNQGSRDTYRTRATRDSGKEHEKEMWIDSPGEIVSEIEIEKKNQLEKKTRLRDAAKERKRYRYEGGGMREKLSTR